MILEIVEHGKHIDKALEIAITISRRAPLGIHATIVSARKAQIEGFDQAAKDLMPQALRFFKSEDVRSRTIVNRTAKRNFFGAIIFLLNEFIMNIEASKVFSELESISTDALKTFGNLSERQINWKPSADGWSVGQCFEHLIKTNELFYDELDRVASGERRNSFLENYSPLSGVFGNLLVNSLKKDARKFKAPSQKIVPPSEIDANIVEIFAGHQAELIGKIKKTASADWRKIKITSPFMKFMTYRLSDGFQVVIEHEKRHIRQAERVTKMENFLQN